MRIGHYELLDPIRRSETSEIYRARDLRLEREVAIKLLRPEAAGHPAARERFRREARISSLVMHPHIWAVHDFGDEDGRPFLVCELLEGRPLADAAAGTPLPAERVVEIGAEIADAIAAAHRRGIVHGNLTASNVFLTSDGHLKLLELGAAAAAAPEAPRRPDSSASHTTAIDAPVLPAAGLPHPYLAPEQVAGTGADHRADIFSIGAVLYEMATGRRPFDGSSPAQLAAAIVASEPPRPRSLNPRLPASVDAIIRRALEKDPDRRYQTAADLLDELRRARRTIEAEGATRRRMPRLAPAAVAAALGAGLLLLAWWTGIPARYLSAGGAAPSVRNTILVSHIANGTGDPVFDDTLREAVSVYLAQSPHLEIVSDDRIGRTLQLMGRDPATRLTHEMASEVCQRLGLQAMLEGSVAAVGRVTVIALVATDCASGATIARHQVEVERKEDVLRATGPLSEAVRASLGEPRASLARHNVGIEEATTPSLEALKAYTEAGRRRAAGAEMDAVPFLERAIALDPGFALAYTTLSTLYGGLGETTRSEEYARLAYEHRGQVSERERLFIASQFHDRSTGNQLKAREALEVWKRTYPRDYRPANALAVLLNRLGDYDRAAAEAREAIARNPDHPFPYSNLAYAHRGAGRYTEARKVAESIVARGIETVPTRRLLYQLAVLDGDQATAEAQLEWAAGSPRGFDLTGARAQVQAFAGRSAEARQLYRATVAAAGHAGFAEIAAGYAAQAALTDAIYGYEREAAAWARQVPANAPNEPRLRAAAALALAGRIEDAEAIVRRLQAVRPEDTLLHGAYMPAARGAVLLARNRPAEAVEALRPAAPYERGLVAALIPVWLRGEARRRSGAFDEAAAEFRRVLEHRGADPFSAIVPMAELGLARALAGGGRAEEARAAYDRLLARWAGADADLPPLVAARQEQEALAGPR